MTGAAGEGEELRVGVTGHRFLAEAGRVEAGVEEAIRLIEREFPGRALTVLSSLAEGADRMVARRVLARRGAHLVAVLPLARGEYEKCFETAGSREEFGELLTRAREVVTLRGGGDWEEAYEAAGMRVLERSDVLVAVWDGRRTQGRGGTGDIVGRARADGLPVVWVHAGNRRPGTNDPVSLGPKQGRVTLLNFHADAGD